jgi:hypothetical protein
VGLLKRESMKIYYEKKPEGLFPLHESDKENHKRLRNGALFMKDFKKVRNPKFHALIFGFLNDVFPYQSDYIDFERFRDRVTLLTGYYTEELMEDSQGILRAKIKLCSWEFGKMDELEFRDLAKKVKDVCWRHYIPSPDDRVELEKIHRKFLSYD